MPFSHCEEVTLYYEAHGEGPSLLLLAGLGGGTWSWYGQVPYFKEHYRTICFDNRGAGHSSVPSGPYRMIQLAEDALCLLDHLDVERAFVLGLSMGGMIAQELVLLAPERILALFLGCTHCGGSLRVPPAPDTLRLLAANAGLSQKEIVEKNLPIFFSQACRKEDPEATAAYCAAQLSSPVQPEYAFLAQLAAIQDFDSTERIGQINVPTMIVTGSEDILVPPENAQILAKLIHNAEMAVIPGAGHALHAECPETLNSLADGFFRHCLPGGLHRGSG